MGLIRLEPAVRDEKISATMPILASPLKPNNPKLLSEIARLLVCLDHVAKPYRKRGSQHRVNGGGEAPSRLR